MQADNTELSIKNGGLKIINEQSSINEWHDLFQL